MATAKANVIAGSTGVQAETLTGATTLVAPGGLAAAGEVVMTSDILALDPGGAGRTVTLAPAADVAGLTLTIVNTADAAEDLTISDGSTVITISQGETGVVRAVDTDWYAVSVSGIT